MVAKKSLKASLENKKSIFVLLGFVVGLSLVFIALEWSGKDVKLYPGPQVDLFPTDEPVVPVTKEAKPLPPPPPPPAAITELKIVSDTEKPKPVEFTSETNETESNPINTVGPIKVEEDPGDVPFTYVEKMPEFPGNIFKFLSDNIHYPQIAIENQIQGRVYCEFVVNRDGSIVDVKVVRSVDPSLDREAVRVINSMPKWHPGMQRDKAVRVKYTLPINFKLTM